MLQRSVEIAHPVSGITAVYGAWGERLPNVQRNAGFLILCETGMFPRVLPIEQRPT